MKKLLSILASVAVAGSSASAVVACGVPFNKQANSDTGNSDNNSSSSDNTTDGDGWINDGKQNKPHDDSNNGNSNNKQGVAKFNAQLNDVEGTLTNQVKQQAPLDIWGFNGETKNPVLDYLNHAKDSKGNPVLDDKTKSTIEAILGMTDGVSMPSPTALGSMISGIMPLLPALAPTLVDKIGGKDKIADIEKTVNGILTDTVKGYVNEFVKNGTTLEKFDKLTLNESMESATVGAAYILGVLTNDRAGVEMFKDLTDPEKIISITGLADETQIDRAIDYISLTVEQIFFGQKNISLIAKGNSFDDKTPDKPKITLTDDDIDVISDTIQLFSFYIGQFDQFRFKDDATNIDANNIFDTSIIPNGSAMSNYDVVNYVRTKKIGDIRKTNSDSLKFNPLRLISDISYYLGELDKPNGIYRVQALFSILFMDMDRTKADHIILNWDDSDTAKKRVHGWTDAAGAESEEERKTPLSRVIQHVMASIMENKTPDVFKDTSTFSLGWLIEKLGFSWDSISTWAVHNIYMIIQSIVWNKGFELSTTDTGFSVISHPGSDGYGMDVLNNEHDIKIIVDIFDYPGLASLSQWSSIQKDGLLRLLFNDSDANIYELLNEISSNDGWVKMLNKINSMASGKADILSMLKTKVLPTVVPFTNEDKGYNTSSAAADLKDSMSKYNQVEFENAGKKTIINSQIKTLSDNSAWEDNPGKHGKSWWDGTYGSVKHPTIDKVVADKTVDGKTDLYISAINLYNKDVTSKDYIWSSDDHNKKVTGVQGMPYTNAAEVLAKTITIDGKKPIDWKVLDKTSGGTYCSAKIKVTIDFTPSQNMDVEGWTFFYQGMYWAYNYGQQAQIGNKHINMPWVQDDLGIYKVMGFDPANPTFDVRTLNFADGGLDKFKHLRVNGMDSKGNETNLLDNVRVSGLSVNVKTVASHAVEWLLNVLGIDNNPMHLPFMDDNTMGSLILEIGKQIDKIDPNDDSEAQKDNAKLNEYLNSFGIDIKRFKYLIDVIFGAPGQDNVITRLFNILTGDKANMASDLTKLLGAQGSNTYSKTGLIGALLYAFTPGLVGSDDDNPIIMGNTQKASPIWDKLLGDTGIIKSAWSWLNDYDISELTTFNQVNADSNYDSKFTKKDGDWNLTNAEGVITYTYKWEVRIKNDDGTFAYKWRTLTAKYNVSATRKNKDSKWSYKVEKAGEPVTTDLD